MPASSNPLPADVLAALQAGHKIEAIKLLREASGLGLKESKEAIDNYIDASSQETPSGMGMGAPGEVSRSGKLIGWSVALTAVALAAYYVLRSPN